MRTIIAVMALFVLTALPVSARVGGGDITLKNRGGDVLFSHETHVAGKGLKCTQCHDRLYTDTRQHRKVSMQEMRQGKSCGACHDGKKAFGVKGDCARCHKK